MIFQNEDHARLFIHLLNELHHRHQIEIIANSFEGISDAGVALACGRVEYLIKKKPQLIKEINYLINLVTKEKKYLLIVDT